MYQGRPAVGSKWCKCCQQVESPQFWGGSSQIKADHSIPVDISIRKSVLKPYKINNVGQDWYFNSFIIANFQ